MLRYYNNSLVKALMHLLPEIGLEPLKFTQLPSKFLLSPLILSFLDKEFSDSNSLLQRSFGWAQKTEECSSRNMRRRAGLIRSLRPTGMASLPLYCNRSMYALPLSLTTLCYSTALILLLHPLLSNCFSIQRGKSVLEYYHWSVPNALHDVFPSIGLDTERFTPESK